MIYKSWDILEEYCISEDFEPNFTIELFNLYSKNDKAFLNAYKLFKEGFFATAYNEFKILVFKEPENLDYLFGLSSCSFYINSLSQTINYLNKCVMIANSYHCYFHYFGFEICMKLFKKTGEERFKNRGFFLYPKGESAEDCLPSFKNLCIFEGSNSRNAEPEKAFELSEKEHYEYHLASAKVYFLRALCFKKQGLYSTAKVDLQRALDMESKNPLNAEIKKIYAMLCVPN